jgi:hypothetical protein
MKLIGKFLSTDVPPPREIAQIKVPVNMEAWNDIQLRIAKAKESLGDRYLCHPTKRVQRHTEEA